MPPLAVHNIINHDADLINLSDNAIVYSVYIVL